MRVTQGTFSYLPDLTDDQIRREVEYAMRQNLSISVESTDNPHPRNVYWDMWCQPLFDLPDASVAMSEIAACRRAYPARYVKVNAFDASSGWETVRLSFIVQRPPVECGFALERQAGPGRTQRYSLHAHPVESPIAARGGKP